MRKRIFIAIHYMELGGAERALLGLLEALEAERYEVDLFVYSHQGELMEHIPPHIHLLPENPVYAAYEKPIMQVFKRGHWGMVAARLWAKVMNRWYNRHLTGQVSSILDEVGRATSPILPSLHHLGEYDVAISFLTPHYVVRDKVRAKRKIAWIHTDYSVVQVNAKRELPVWAAYDHIVSISPDVTRTFLHCFPTLSSKIVEQENLLPVKLIQRQAEAFDAAPEMPGKIRLLSIGRFSPPKNFPGAVEIMSELCKLRDDVTWYIIGYGGGEAEIREAIERYGMQEKFIILGKKSNPYPYTKACDLYVQPSIYEGKSMTVKEAQLLSKPVAITRYPTAAGQIKDDVNGRILPLDSPYDTAESLHSLLSDYQKISLLSTNGCAEASSQKLGNHMLRIFQN